MKPTEAEQGLGCLIFLMIVLAVTIYYYATNC